MYTCHSVSTPPTLTPPCAQHYHPTWGLAQRRDLENQEGSRQGGRKDTGAQLDDWALKVVGRPPKGSQEREMAKVALQHLTG